MEDWRKERDDPEKSFYKMLYQMSHTADRLRDKASDEYGAVKLRTLDMAETVKGMEAELRTKFSEHGP